MLTEVTSLHPRLYELVADQIRDLIASGAIQVGERLPAERELAKNLGVSRIVIREAVKILRSEGIIDIRPGSGTYVLEPNANYASSALMGFLRMRRGNDSFLKLLEVRKTLEIDIAGCAASKATPADCDRLEELIQWMERHRNDAAKYAESDHAFHIRLATSTHNELYELLLKPIAGLLYDFRVLLHSRDPVRTVDAGVEQHREILRAVRERHVTRAKRAMRDHLCESRSIFLKIIHDEPTSDGL